MFAVERGHGRGARDTWNRERHHRLAAFPGDGRVAEFRNAGSEQSARVALHGGQWDSGAREGRLQRGLRTCPETDQPFLHRARHRRGLAFARDDLGARDVLVPCVLAADDLDRGICLAVRSRAGVLYALTGRLVIGARSILRQRARLTVDLHSALAGVFERDRELVLVETAQLDHVPAPVEQNRLQILGVRSGRVGRRSVPIGRLRTRDQRQAEGQDEPKRHPRAVIPSKGHHDPGSN